MRELLQLGPTKYVPGLRREKRAPPLPPSPPLAPSPSASSPSLSSFPTAPVGASRGLNVEDALSDVALVDHAAVCVCLGVALCRRCCDCVFYGSSACFQCFRYGCVHLRMLILCLRRGFCLRLCLCLCACIFLLVTVMACVLSAAFVCRIG